VGNCAAVGELGKELVSSYPYKRGVSMEAAYTGLPDEDVERLRNRNQDSEKALRRAAAELQRSANLAAEYLSKQEILEQFGLEESNQDPPPEQPRPAYYPSRWTEGIELRAQQAYRNFLVANSRWGVSGVEFHDVLTELPTITAKTGETINITDADINTVLQQKRIDMLVEEGIVNMEASPDLEREEGAEYDDYEEHKPPATAVLSSMPPPLYAELFGPEEVGENSVLECRRLIGFMVYIGVRATADELAAAREEREEYEAEEEARAERELRAIEESKAREQKERGEFEALHKELVAARNDLASRAKIAHDGNRQLPKSMSSGQLMAHFSYICLNMEAKLGVSLQPPSRFGLKVLSEAPRSKPRCGHDLHEALFTGKVAIEEVTGTGFGKGSLNLSLRSMSSEPIQVAIRRGTIFQQVDWVHKQNLLVAVDYLLTIPAGGVEGKSMMAYCMNLSCSCSSREPMELTDFYFDTSHVLDSQGNVWDHFERCFGHR